MKVGITARFQNSYFSGSIPQVACALSRTLVKAGHTVELIYPKDEKEWFVDLVDHQINLPPRVPFGLMKDKQYDTIIEVCWSLEPEDRVKYAKRTIYLAHYPPIFHDTEICVYQSTVAKRNFTNVHAVWTYDFFSKHDIEYLEFLSGVPTQQIPYVWDSEPLDLFVQKEKIPTWQEGASAAEAALPNNLPPSMSWILRVFESNYSNTSHCILPMSIISEIRKTVEPVRFCVHNTETTKDNEFMKNNIIKNLIMPDANQSMIPRVRVPDTRREKTVIIAHQRFRPIKSFLLDAMYVGIPMVHNNKLLKGLGAPYFYELNQIRDAVAAFRNLRDDYVGKSGFFHPSAAAERIKMLNKTFSPASLSSVYNDRLLETPKLSRPLPMLAPREAMNELRIAFALMWDGFQPHHNFFTYLLQWVGKLNNISVVVDQKTPNLVFWGPLSLGTEQQWPMVPKVYFTGENARAVHTNNTILNIGFDYANNMLSNYIRLPLWVMEVNWWGGDVDKMVNPRPVSVTEATTVPVTTKPRDFCAFVATNPSNSTRNAIFQAINAWRPVASGGRLFCNLPGGPIPAGLGGGGGELAKIEFYKGYKYVITAENSSNPGYTTEKLFHAKVAGCVPIYWGDAYVDRDFDANGFINVTHEPTLEAMIAKVQSLVDKEDTWKTMASIPAITPFKRKWCEKTMAHVAQTIFNMVLNKKVSVTDVDWVHAETFATTSLPLPQPIPHPISQSESIVLSKDRVFVTATNAKFLESACNAIKSLKVVDPTTKSIVFIWPDVTTKHQELLQKVGADEVRLLPVNQPTVTPWADFWDPEHYAWKLWIHKTMLDEIDTNTSMLYCDSGMIFVRTPIMLWEQIAKHGILAIDDPSQQNKRWCHPTFCGNMKVTEAELEANQLWAGCFGYRKGAYDAIANEALRIASVERDTIVGSKWSRYSTVCMGHRHDQSILSVLTQRARVPRIQLNDVYCDLSHRAAEQFGVPLYVHRGNYKPIQSFVDGIDEGYVINLVRRKDRLDSFKTAHPNLKEKVYIVPAVDGLTLQLTPKLVDCFRNNDFKWKKSVMGCALSHLTLWEKLANDVLAKTYLIMEDDVRFQNNWLAQWYSMVQHIPKDADVIYLGGVLPPNKCAQDHITEKVNPYFARVAKNTLYGPTPRRYFHFCNYSYVLTQTGAQKLVSLVKERGIFTSGDHMIVNHGDSYLNIYFTVPLLATCFQEADPVYQAAEFNNFQRVDNFDSDLWNNTDCFSLDEVASILSPTASVPAPSSAPAPAPAPSTASNQDPPKLEIKELIIPKKTDAVQLWNTFLKNISLKQKTDLPETIRSIFELWKQMDNTEFQKHVGWFRIFEQFVTTRNAELMENAKLILDCIDEVPSNRKVIYKDMIRVLTDNKDSNKPSIPMFHMPAIDKQVIFHLPEIDPTFILETDWLSHVYDKPIVWKKLEAETNIGDVNNPTLLYMRIPGKEEYVKTIFQNVAKQLESMSVTMTLLHLSDEYGKDDLSIYETKVFPKVIRNYWRPNLPKSIIQLPLGYTNGRSHYGYAETPTFADRKYLWTFTGSLDRPGRVDSLFALEKTGNYRIFAKESWDKPYVQDGPQYIDQLRNSKFVPCFAGSSALESYRLYEALEHGAIPFYVAAKTDEYKEMYGTVPFLGFPSWDSAAKTLPLLAEKHDIIEKHRKNCLQWWAEKKQSLRNLVKPTAN